MRLGASDILVLIGTGWFAPYSEAVPAATSDQVQLTRLFGSPHTTAQGVNLSAATTSKAESQSGPLWPQVSKAATSSDQPQNEVGPSAHAKLQALTPATACTRPLPPGRGSIRMAPMLLPVPHVAELVISFVVVLTEFVLSLIDSRGQARFLIPCVKLVPQGFDAPVPMSSACVLRRIDRPG